MSDTPKNKYKLHHQERIDHGVWRDCNRMVVPGGWIYSIGKQVLFVPDLSFEIVG